jgi:hypothetical protein
MQTQSINLKERDHLGHAGIDGDNIKVNLKLAVWTRFVWLGRGSNLQALVYTVMRLVCTYCCDMVYERRVNKLWVRTQLWLVFNVHCTTCLSLTWPSSGNLKKKRFIARKLVRIHIGRKNLQNCSRIQFAVVVPCRPSVEVSTAVGGLWVEKWVRYLHLTNI